MVGEAHRNRKYRSWSTVASLRGVLPYGGLLIRPPMASRRRTFALLRGRATRDRVRSRAPQVPDCMLCGSTTTCRAATTSRVRPLRHSRFWSNRKACSVSCDARRSAFFSHLIWAVAEGRQAFQICTLRSGQNLRAAKRTADASRIERPSSHTQSNRTR